VCLLACLLACVTAAVIILNKLDLVTDEQRVLLRSLLHRLNPDATLLESTQSVVPVRTVLVTAKWQFASALHDSD
jgi:G3E family GTPase